MNHEKRNHKQKIKKSTSKHKKKLKYKKPDIKAIVKKKTFKVGNSSAELRMQFDNFSSRYINLRASMRSTPNKTPYIKELAEALKINYTNGFDIDGLSVRQLQYRVGRLKELLDTLRTRRKLLSLPRK